MLCLSFFLGFFLSFPFFFFFAQPHILEEYFTNKRNYDLADCGKEISNTVKQMEKKKREREREKCRRFRSLVKIHQIKKQKKGKRN